MALSKRRRKPIAEMNVVPYIDVMLVLLVIFMVTAPMLTQGIKVSLPQTHTRTLSTNTPLPIIVSIDADGKYYLNDSAAPKEAISPTQLTTQVAALLAIAKQEKAKRAVYVKGDKAARYGMIANAMSLLQIAGANQVGLITQPISDK